MLARTGASCWSWCDRDSRAHRWAIPLRLIHRHGNEIAEELESAGLSCGSDENAHRLLKRFLSMVKITRRLRCVSRTGWHDGGTAPVLSSCRAVKHSEGMQPT